MRRFFTVIHTETFAQARMNIEISMEGGADGCFLINHSIKPLALKEIVEQMMKEYQFFIGANYLGADDKKLSELIIRDQDAVWVDNLGIDETKDYAGQDLPAIIDSQVPTTTDLFGGVAFKYQRQVKIEDLAKATELACAYCDVVTTSGMGTGQAPDLAKIETMKEIVAGFNYPRLGLASGVSVKNVWQFLPYVDDYLVASSISKSFNMLDKDKVKELADLIRG